jgi:N-acetylmuramic acid 6-phosphate (MurNAc-6-P) etherase
MTSLLTSAGLPAQDIIVKIAANGRKPMIFFIKKFELKTLHFVTALFSATQL